MASLSHYREAERRLTTEVSDSPDQGGDGDDDSGQESSRETVNHLSNRLEGAD